VEAFGMAVFVYARSTLVRADVARVDLFHRRNLGRFESRHHKFCHSGGSI